MRNEQVGRWRITGHPLPAVVVVLAVAVPTLAHSARGYIPRPCGFDLDGDGVVGENTNCGQVNTTCDCDLCDGTTADPDGDGVNEDLIYVDCAGGTDRAGCGSVVSPCRTVAYAWTVVADGPADGAEDVVCFRGTCTAEPDEIAPRVSGVSGVYVVPASGSEARPFQYPQDPTMVVGWDVDRDRQYPPFDTGDVAVLDGGPRNLHRAFAHSNLVSFVEYAHFSARNYLRGRGGDQDGGFIDFGDASGRSTHIYLHDLSLRAITRESAGSSAIVFELFTGGTRYEHIAVRNAEVLEWGSFLARGGGTNADTGVVDGPIRFQNLTATCHGIARGQCYGFKLWGYLTGVEILDSVFDANPSAWSPCSSGVDVQGCHPTYAIAPAQCSQDWVIRNNLFLSYKQTLHINGDAGPTFCQSRPTDDVVFDRNTVRNTYAPWEYGDYAVSVTPSDRGSPPAATVGDVSISNNLLESTSGWEACLWIDAGHQSPCAGDNPGTVRILDNTCRGDINRHAAIVIGDPEGEDSTCKQQDFVITGNLITGLGPGDVNVNTQYAPRGWNVDYNIYDANAPNFSWNSSSATSATATSLTAWRQQSRGDANATLATGSGLVPPVLLEVVPVE